MVEAGLERIDIVRLQMRRNHQLHLAATADQMSHPAGREGQPVAAEITRGTAVEQGFLEAGHEEILHEVIATGAIGVLRGYLGEAHLAVRSAGKRRFAKTQGGPEEILQRHP